MKNPFNAFTTNPPPQAEFEKEQDDSPLIPEKLLKFLDEIAATNLRDPKKDRLLFTFQAFAFEPGEYTGDDLRPDEMYRDKESISVLHTELRGERLREFFQNAKKVGWDVTLTSKVDYQAKNLFESSGFIKSVRHIPMIDFACRPDADVLAEAVKTHLIEAAGLEVLVNGDFAFFASGRSFHGYGVSLLKSEEWVPFMGKLLLLNIPEYEDIVDQRWVGHRLTKGFGALRWTKNNPKYLQAPDEIECPF